MTQIRKGVFSGCTNLKSIVIPDSVTTIGEEAFKGCSGLQSIALPDSVTTIGEEAFDGCTNLKSIVIPSRVKLTKTFNYYISPKSRVIPSGATLTKAFRNCTRLNSIELSDGGARITRVIFGDFTSLHSIIIPDSISFIEHGALSDCKNLQLITIKTEKKDPDMSREKI